MSKKFQASEKKLLKKMQLINTFMEKTSNKVGIEGIAVAESLNRVRL